KEGERERGQRLARGAVAEARRLGDLGLLVTTLVELIVMLDGQPDQRDQLAAADELRTLDRRHVPSDVESAVVLRLARIDLAHGEASALERDGDDFARAAVAARRPDEQLWATWAKTAIAFLHDRLDEAEALAADAFGLHQQLGIWGAAESFASHMVLI